MSALTDRINFLARKEKAEGLTAEEKEEQIKLREQFRAAFRRNFAAQLQNTTFVTEDGKVIEPKIKGD
ncbi:MAG: DUF896 domain-containing protein [Eubacteriales bacterium]